jgi:hypothetical protein
VRISRRHYRRKLIAELNQAVLGKRQTAVVGDDHVIEHADHDQLQGFAPPARDQLVRLAGLGDAGRVLGCISECHRHLFVSVPSPTVPHT